MTTKKIAAVEVLDSATNEVVHRVPCREHDAPKVESGLMINMDHARFHTRVVRAAASGAAQGDDHADT